MKQTKRFLALLLAFSICLSMVTPAYASETGEEPVVAETTEAVTEVDEEIVIDEELLEDDDIFADEEVASEEAANVGEDNPVGSENNPEIRTELGMLNVSLEEGDADGYFYSYTAEATGNVELSLNKVAEGIVADVEVSTTAGESKYTLIGNGMDEEENSQFLRIPVNEDDVLTIHVGVKPDEAGNYPAVQFILLGMFHYTEGSAGNPIPINFNWNDARTEATATVMAPVGTTYYSVADGNGMLLSINGEDPEMLSAATNASVIFTITNEGEAEAEYSLKLTWPEIEKPAIEAFGNQYTSVPAGAADGYAYTYTPTETDTVYISLVSVVAFDAEYNEIPATVDIVAEKQMDDGLEQRSLCSHGENGVLALEVSAGEQWTISVMVIDPAHPVADVIWNFGDNPYGSEENPIALDWKWEDEMCLSATATVVVPANMKHFFVSNGVGGMVLTIDGGNKQTLVDQGVGCAHSYFSITNDSDLAREFNLSIAYPVGSERNPEKLDALDGAISTTLENGNPDGYYYTYTASAAGYVNVAMTSVSDAVEADISVTRSRDYESMNMDDAENGSICMPVAAGDVLYFNIRCSESDYPAIDVVWTGFVSMERPGTDKSAPLEITFVMNEDNTEGDATVFVPAGTTYYVKANVNGMVLTIDGENEQLLKSENLDETSVCFPVTNSETVDKDFALHVAYPVGHKLNPAQLTDISLIQVSLEEGNADGYHYLYDATEEGTVVLAGQNAGEASFDVIITNLNTNLQNAMKDSGNGTVAMAVMPGDELHIQIVALPDSENTIPAVDVVARGKFVYPVGHASNPEEIALGTVKATIKAETQGRYYKLTASKSGILLFKMNTKSGWTYSIGNVTEGIWNDEQTSDGGAAVSTIYVNKGDEVEIKVNTYNPKNPGSAPAGSVSFAVEMKKVDFEVISGKKLTLTFYDAAGKKVSGSKVDWSIEEAYVYDPDGNRVYFDNFDAYATMKSGALSTKACGDRIHMIVKAALKTDKSVSALYYVDIMPAANKLAIWTEEAPVYNNNLSWILNWQASKMKLNAFSHPVNANQKVTWSSSNKKVITIASDGTMRATGVAGKSTITATAADGSKKKASVVVEVVRYAEYIEIVRKDGKKLDDIQQICGFDEKGFPIYETVKGAVVDAGKSIQLKANVDPKASDKKVTWYTGSNFAKVSSSGKVTISKDAPDDYDVWVYAESCGYHQEFIIKVNNDKVTVDFWHLNDENFYDGSVVWMESNNEVTFNTTGLKANQIPTLIERGVEIDSNGIKVRDVKNYKLSGSKVVDMKIIYYWYHESGKQEVTDIKNVPDYVAEDDIYVDVKIKPKAGVTGKATITAVSADGKSKSVFTINVVNYPTKIQLTNKDGKKLWQEIYDYGTGEYTVVNGVKLQAVPGQTVTLKANTDVKQKVSWYAYQININRDGEYTGENQVKISNGKLTVPKDIVEETEIWVYADINRDKVNWKEAGTYIRVTPKASNLHIFAELNGTKYVSNTTKAFDINTDADGNGTADKALKLSAKVYPFSAGQKVTWSVKGASATIVTNKDGSATLKLTGKTGKATVTATANDGSKVKSTFTLDVVRPVIRLNLKNKLEVNAGKSLALAKMLTIDPANATNKKVTWSLKMKDQKGKLVDVPKTIATLSSSGSLATKKTAKGLTLYVTVTAQDGFGAMANTSVVVK